MVSRPKWMKDTKQRFGLDIASELSFIHWEVGGMKLHTKGIIEYVIELVA